MKITAETPNLEKRADGYVYYGDLVANELLEIHLDNLIVEGKIVADKGLLCRNKVSAKSIRAAWIEGGQVHASGNVIVEGHIKVQNKLSAAYLEANNITVGSTISLSRIVCTHGNLQAADSVQADDDILVKGFIRAESIRAGGNLEAGADIKVWTSMHVYGSIKARKIMCKGGSIMAQGDISALTSIFAGKNITTEGNINAGGLIEAGYDSLISCHLILRGTVTGGKRFERATKEEKAKADSRANDSREKIDFDGTHIIYGEFVLTGIKNAFNQKTGWWLSKHGYTHAVYCFSTSGSAEEQQKELEEQTKNMSGYFRLFKVR